MIKITKIIVLTLFVTFVFALFSVEIRDPDFWWHLKTGEHIVQTGSIPAIDPFAYTSTPKDPLSPESVRIKFILAQYWLAQIFFYQIYSAFGFQGVIFLRAFILTLLVFLVYRSIRREGMGFYLSLALTVPAVLILYTFTGERPQLFSFLFSFLIVFLLEGYRKKASTNNSKTALDVIRRSPEPVRDDAAIPASSQKITARSPRSLRSLAMTKWGASPRDDSMKTIAYLIPLPFIMLLWANLHGGFIVGIGLLLCYLVAEWMKYFWFMRINPEKAKTEPTMDSPIKSGNDEKGGRQNSENRAHKNVIPVKTGIHSAQFQSTSISMRQLKLLSGVVIVSILFTLVNPNTYKVIPFLIELEGGLYKSFIVETMSPLVLFRSGFYEIQFFVFFGLLFVIALLFLLRMRNTDLTDVVVVAVLAVASLFISRFIPYFTPVAVLMIARHSKSLQESFSFKVRDISTPSNEVTPNVSPPSTGGDEGEGVKNVQNHPHPNPPPSMGREVFESRHDERNLRELRPRTQGKLLLANIFKKTGTFTRELEVPFNSFLIIVLILMLINGDMFKKGVRPNKYPEGAARFLKENRIAGNMFNPYAWGGHLMWSLYPDYKVFIDGRGLIPEVFFQEVRVLEASSSPVRKIPEWKAILNAYNVNFIVTFSVGTFTGRLVPLIPALLNDPEWHLVYMDNISLIFVRDSEGNQEIISRFSFPKEWLWNEVAVEAALKAKDAPNRGNYYETIGDAFFAKRSYPEALEAYLKALELRPGSTRLMNRVDQVNSIMRSQGR